MVEELYIIDKNGVRQSVDLNTPSGITLKWVSNMFNSLDKVNCSYSYTFKIPMTRHNREVLDSAEDIRMQGTMLRKKIKAEYLQNGIPLFGNGNLYIDKVADNSYSCVFTWGVVEGLQKLKDDGCSLNELRDALAKAGEKTYELGVDLLDWKAPFHTPNTFNNNYDIMTAYYLSGIGPDSDPFYITDRNVYPYDKHTDLWKITGIALLPKPTMPVKRLISYINTAFGTKFNLGKFVEGNVFNERPAQTWLYDDENIISYGVLPLVGISITDKQMDAISQKTKYKRFVTKEKKVTQQGFIHWEETGKIFGDIYLIFFDGKESLFSASIDPIGVGPLFYKTKDENGNYINWDMPNTYNELQLKYKSFFIESQFEFVGVQSKYRIRMQGSFNVTTPKYDVTDENLLKFVVKSWKDVDVLSSNRHLEKIDVTSLSPYKYEQTTDKNIFYFNFNTSDGFKYAEFKNDENETWLYQEYWFGFNQEITDVEIITALSFAPVVNDLTSEAHIIDSFSNLPDIDCISFMKSLFYMLGGFPYVTKKGTIEAKKYIELKKNLKEGNVYNWSGKVLSNNLPDELTSHLSDFKQNNYYLNKWDDLDRSKEELEDEDDVYEDGIGNVLCNDETLDKEQTVHQLPFYSPYVKNRKSPGYGSGGTIKTWDLDLSEREISFDKELKLAKLVESKSAFGFIHRVPFFSSKTEWKITEWSQLRESSVSAEFWMPFAEPWQSVLRMSILNPFKDILMNPSYRYVQQIVEKPFVITENLLLNEFDLLDIDYTKPIYLEKYNSYFGIISIQRDSKGVSKCELIKLPAYKSPTKIYVKLSYVAGIYYLRCDSTDNNINLKIGLKIEENGLYIYHRTIDTANYFKIISLHSGSTNKAEIKDVWVSEYQKGDYNDYEFEIGQTTYSDIIQKPE